MFVAGAAFSHSLEPGWRAFDVSTVAAAAGSAGQPCYEFLTKPAMTAGLCIVNPGEEAAPQIYKLDTVYIVVSGKGGLAVGDDSVSLVKGSIVFVRAGVRRKFEKIESSVSAIELSSTAKSGSAEPRWMAMTVGEARKKFLPDRNVWNRFFSFETLHLGLYMLPRALGGDSPLTHKVDEINIVTRGHAIFRVGDSETPVKPGSIVWVGQGNPHSFHSLSDDFDVLIMFNQKPGVPSP